MILFSLPLLIGCATYGGFNIIDQIKYYFNTWWGSYKLSGILYTLPRSFKN